MFFFKFNISKDMIRSIMSELFNRFVLPLYKFQSV